MPRPIVPVIDDPRARETLAGLHQPEYDTLPALRGNAPTSPMTSCWEFTDDELEYIKQNGRKIWLTQLTYDTPLQPIMVWHFAPTYEQCMDPLKEV